MFFPLQSQSYCFFLIKNLECLCPLKKVTHKLYTNPKHVKTIKVKLLVIWYFRALTQRVQFSFLSLNSFKTKKFFLEQNIFTLIEKHFQSPQFSRLQLKTTEMIEKSFSTFCRNFNPSLKRFTHKSHPQTILKLKAT